MSNWCTPWSLREYRSFRRFDNVQRFRSTYATWYQTDFQCSLSFERGIIGWTTNGNLNVLYWCAVWVVCMKPIIFPSFLILGLSITPTIPSFLSSYVREIALFVTYLSLLFHFFCVWFPFQTNSIVFFCYKKSLFSLNQSMCKSYLTKCSDTRYGLVVVLLQTRFVRILISKITAIFTFTINEHAKE